MLVSPYKGVADGESGRDGTGRREVNELDGGESASDSLMEPLFSESDPTVSDVSSQQEDGQSVLQEEQNGDKDAQAEEEMVANQEDSEAEMQKKLKTKSGRFLDLLHSPAIKCENTDLKGMPIMTQDAKTACGQGDLPTRTKGKVKWKNRPRAQGRQ